MQFPHSKKLGRSKSLYACRETLRSNNKDPAARVWRREWLNERFLEGDTCLVESHEYNSWTRNRAAGFRIQKATALQTDRRTRLWGEEVVHVMRELVDTKHGRERARLLAAVISSEQFICSLLTGRLFWRRSSLLNTKILRVSCHTDAELLALQ